MKLIFWHHQPLVSGPLKAMLLISGLFMFANAMLLPLYAIFVESIGGDITTASNSYALFWLTAGLLTFVAGKFENKMKESELALAWAMYITSAGYLLYYFTKTTSILYLAMVILGIASAIFWPAFHSIYAKHTDGPKAAWQWSFYDGLAYIIPAIGAALGGWMVKTHGFDPIFITMAAIAFCVGTFVVFLPRKLL